MMGSVQTKPCGDCAPDARCTMNCGPSFPKVTELDAFMTLLHSKFIQRNFVCFNGSNDELLAWARRNEIVTVR